MTGFRQKLSSFMNKTAVFMLAALVLAGSLWFGRIGYAEEGAGGSGTSADLKAVYDRLAAGEQIQSEREYKTPEQPTVYLTFDDGPSRLTPKVLDILQEAGVKATFFELGQQVEAYPEAVKRVVREGHAVGNHTFDHVYADLYGSLGHFWEQVQKTDAAFDRTIGMKPDLLRAPGGTAGNFDAIYYYELAQAGYTVFDWNIDSGDSTRQGVPAEEIINTVKKGPFPHEAIVLMHDGAGHAETVKALPEIIKLFKDKGYAFATLSQRVKPVQFGVKQVRWKRQTGFDTFLSILDKAREHAQMLQKEQGAAGTDEAGGAGSGEAGKAGGGSGGQAGESTGPPGGGPTASAPKPAVVPALQVRLAFPPAADVSGGNSAPEEAVWELKPGAYDFHQGRFAVPLRTFVEKIGGKVEWDSAKRTATVRFGLYAAEYDLGHMTLREFAPGAHTRTVHLPDMRIVDGQLLVPLRGAADMLGCRVSGYRLDETQRSVDMAVGTGISFCKADSLKLGV